MHKPLISIILPTKDNLRTIRRCLESIEAQSYPHFEVIFVDNFSTDSTFAIAQEFESRMQLHAYQVGPERNIQRHAGYEYAKGDILYFVDSDMYLNANLLSEISDKLQDASIGGCIIPETNVGGSGYWSQVKALERSLYEGDDQIEAARVFRRAAYDAVGGYDQSLVSWEDWDLSERIRESGAKIVRTVSRVSHDEGEIDLFRLLRKKFYYGGKFTAYTKSHGSGSALSKIYFFRPSFYRNWREYIARPFLFPGFLFMITAELAAGWFGFLFAKLQRK